MEWSNEITVEFLAFFEKEPLYGTFRILYIKIKMPLMMHATE